MAEIRDRDLDLIYKISNKIYVMESALCTW